MWPTVLESLKAGGAPSRRAARPGSAGLGEAARERRQGLAGGIFTFIDEQLVKTLLTNEPGSGCLPQAECPQIIMFLFRGGSSHETEP